MIQAFANRYYMGNDGVSYLDMADAYLRGDWHAAINTSWNPLYAWFIALNFLLVRPSPYWEYASIQFVNFVIYCLALLSFELFLREWFKHTRQNEDAIRVIAYGVFLWSSLILIGIWTVNADMLVAASFYASLACAMRLKRTTNSLALTAASLGAVLAVGYYSKAIMFPISLVLLMTTCVVRWRGALISTAVFGLLCAPLIVALSKHSGHPTFGETGRVNYAWYVNGVASRWWQGGPPRSGYPEHPPVILVDSPRVYGFGDRFPRATYPIWYDFASWYKGLRVWFSPRQELTAIRGNLVWLLRTLFQVGTGFLLGIAACVIACRNRQTISKDIGALWLPLSTSIVPIMMYSAVHIQKRYIGSFLAVILLTAFTVLRPSGKWLVSAVVVVGLLWATLFVSPPTAGAHRVPVPGASTNEWWAVARDLQQIGLDPNDKIGSVYYSNRRNVFWARLVRARIVAETDWNVDFWRLSAVDQRRVLTALAQAGAAIAVSDEAPPDPANAAGWHQAGRTTFYAYSLRQLSAPVQRDISSRVDEPRRAAGCNEH